VKIELRLSSERLRLEIADDGVGIAPGRLEGTSSLGLVGMRERALACGGTLDVAPRAGGGTVVTLEVPLHPGGAR
jgi:signal transduction histidine kinase